MPGELFTAVIPEMIRRGTEMISNADGIAELGAIKPPGYGTLIRERELHHNATENLFFRPSDELLRYSELSLQNDLEPVLNGAVGIGDNRWLALRPQEVAKEVAEYLCDYGIIPSEWGRAETEQKIDMISQAVKIMGKEMLLPETWLEAIEPEIKAFIPNDGSSITMASASCITRNLLNGSVEIMGIPRLVVNFLALERDYYKAISTIYHEMIHMKQFATIDGVAPTESSDLRLIDLIEEMRKEQPVGSSRIDYLSSPYEAEAWAQELYFEEMLKAVVKERTR